jgi:hypothetical protein
MLPKLSLIKILPKHHIDIALQLLDLGMCVLQLLIFLFQQRLPPAAVPLLLTLKGAFGTVRNFSAHPCHHHVIAEHCTVS